MLPKITRYVECFDETKYISFLIKDEKLFEAYNEIQNRFSYLIKEEFDNEPVHNEKYLKTKVKSYGKMNDISVIMGWLNNVLIIFDCQ